ncbi:MAG: hypothetical protein AAB574_02200 [Patescibacteria group bacterium]
MAPAEIWQGGRIVNKITRDDKNKHEGTIGGMVGIVRGTNSGCELAVRQANGSNVIDTGRLNPGDSITLDGGEIVKSVKK